MNKNIIYFLTCALIWGVTWIAIKFQLPYVDSSAAVFYRFIFSSLILFTICHLQKINLNFSTSTHILFALQGLFLFCLNYQLTYFATYFAPTAIVALAFTALIFFNMFGSRLFFKTPFDKKIVWGALISFTGMGFITWNETQHQQLHTQSVFGFLLSLVATVSASAGNLFSSHLQKKQIPTLSNLAFSMLYGASLTLIFNLLKGKSFYVQFNLEFIISFLYLTLFGTIISFWAYLKLIKNIGPSRAAFTSIASPVIAIAVSVIFENMQLTPWLIMGALLCVLGNILALFKKTIQHESN